MGSRFLSSQLPAQPPPVEPLVQAIQLGADVKVRLLVRSGTFQEGWTRSLPSVTITNPGPNAIVSGMLAETPSLSPGTFNDGWSFSSPLALDWAAFNTTGQTQFLTFDRQTASVIRNDLRIREVQWYVSFGWREVYQNTADGNPLGGSFADLVDAVKAGADIKIRYTRPGGIVWFRTLPSVQIVEDVDESTTPEFIVVSGMLTDIPDSETNPNGRVFSEPFAFEWQVFNSTGKRQTLTFDREFFTQKSTAVDNLSFGWFVRN